MKLAFSIKWVLLVPINFKDVHLQSQELDRKHRMLSIFIFSNKTMVVAMSFGEKRKSLDKLLLLKELLQMPELQCSDR